MPVIRRAKRKFRALSLLEIILVAIATIAIIILFLEHINSSEYKISEIQNTSNDIVIGLQIEEIDRKEVALMSLENWEKEYVQRFNIPLVFISLDYIYISPEFLSANKIYQVCFSKLNLLSNGINRLEQNLAREDLCNGEGLNYFVNQSTTNATFLYSKYDGDYVDPYFYPFDKRSISFAFSADARLLDINNKEISTPIRPTMGVNIISQRGKDFWVLENINNEDLNLTLHRPFMYPVLSVVMLPVIFIAILSLLFLVDDRKEENDDDAEAGYWEVAVGILGIWSIQEVLLPDFIEGPTIIGDIILALYIFLSFIIVFIFSRSIIKRLNKRNREPKKRNVKRVNHG